MAIASPSSSRGSFCFASTRGPGRRPHHRPRRPRDQRQARNGAACLPACGIKIAVAQPGRCSRDARDGRTWARSSLPSSRPNGPASAACGRAVRYMIATVFGGHDLGGPCAIIGYVIDGQALHDPHLVLARGRAAVLARFSASRMLCNQTTAIPGRPRTGPMSTGCGRLLRVPPFAELVGVAGSPRHRAAKAVEDPAENR